ncbi:hypothetical protein H9P43_005303 [Blastocladiella emersonii ATCC 22665]|nr:hypothetical protein H9P43_005276 [Blastocladiella emersonii ATCC 22665]KAI9179971.1 hypothetical protein H9P43_005303 [Blastocladiella emersonii ATCC 22665]
MVRVADLKRRLAVAALLAFAMAASVVCLFIAPAGSSASTAAHLPVPSSVYSASAISDYTYYPTAAAAVPSGRPLANQVVVTALAMVLELSQAHAFEFVPTSVLAAAAVLAPLAFIATAPLHSSADLLAYAPRPVPHSGFLPILTLPPTRPLPPRATTRPPVRPAPLAVECVPTWAANATVAMFPPTFVPTCGPHAITFVTCRCSTPRSLARPVAVVPAAAVATRPRASAPAVPAIPLDLTQFTRHHDLSSMPMPTMSVAPSAAVPVQSSAAGSAERLNLVFDLSGYRFVVAASTGVFGSATDLTIAETPSPSPIPDGQAKPDNDSIFSSQLAGPHVQATLLVAGFISVADRVTTDPLGVAALVAALVSALIRAVTAVVHRLDDFLCSRFLVLVESLGFKHAPEPHKCATYSRHGSITMVAGGPGYAMSSAGDASFLAPLTHGAVVVRFSQVVLLQSIGKHMLRPATDLDQRVAAARTIRQGGFKAHSDRLRDALGLKAARFAPKPVRVAFKPLVPATDPNRCFTDRRAWSITQLQLKSVDVCRSIAVRSAFLPTTARYEEWEELKRRRDVKHKLASILCNKKLKKPRWLRRVARF